MAIQFSSSQSFQGSAPHLHFLKCGGIPELRTTAGAASTYLCASQPGPLPLDKTVPGAYCTASPGTTVPHVCTPSALGLSNQSKLGRSYFMLCNPISPGTPTLLPEMEADGTVPLVPVSGRAVGGHLPRKCCIPQSGLFVCFRLIRALMQGVYTGQFYLAIASLAPLRRPHNTPVENHWSNTEFRKSSDHPPPPRAMLKPTVKPLIYSLSAQIQQEGWRLLSSNLFYNLFCSWGTTPLGCGSCGFESPQAVEEPFCNTLLTGQALFYGNNKQSHPTHYHQFILVIWLPVSLRHIYDLQLSPILKGSFKSEKAEINDHWKLRTGVITLNGFVC